MTPSLPTSQITHLLVAWSNGDHAALEALTPLVHQELHRLAHHYMKAERPGHTLQTSALVNEVYLKLVDQKRVGFKNRSQFLALSATLMRHILVDYARKRRYLKRGGSARKISLKDAMVVSSERSTDVLAVDEALDKLTAIDQRKGKVVELRFFGGLSVEETAAALQISPVTVMREWRMAKAWLYNTLAQ